jgi:putative copper export protein
VSSALHLAVRVVHVVGMVVLLGGATFVWYELGRRPGDSLSLPVQFEWAFWAAMGAMVVTGVGNLGALGPPGPATDWGAVLLGKLLVVAGFVVGSFVRTVAVVRLHARNDPPTDALGRSYGLTAATALAVVVLAEVLAHG